MRYDIKSINNRRKNVEILKKIIGVILIILIREKSFLTKYDKFS